MPQFYSQVKNPVWANEEHTCIDCEVDFCHLDDEFVPFTADPTDSMEYSKTIFDECIMGKYGPIAQYVTPPTPVEPLALTKEELMDKLLEIQAQLENM